MVIDYQPRPSQPARAAAHLMDYEGARVRCRLIYYGDLFPRSADFRLRLQSTL